MTTSSKKTATDALVDIEERLAEVEHGSSFAYDEDGNIDFGTGIRIGDDTVIPPDIHDLEPPTGLTLSPGATLNTIFVDVGWGESVTPSVRQYDVMLVEESTGIISFRALVGGTSTRISGLDPNVTYDVHVRAVDSIGRSSPPLSGQFLSVGDTTTPAPVTGLLVTAGIRSIVATWNESADADVANGNGVYELELREDSGGSPGTLLRTSRTSGTIISWTDLDGDTTYHVRVRAIDRSGNEGTWSDYDSATTAEAAGRDFTTDPITEVEIADDAISAPKIQANAIEAGHLVTGEAVITGTAQIADAIINDAKIIELDAAKVTFGTMSGDRIAANTIDVNRLKTSTLSARTITLASNGRLLANGSSGSLYVDGNGVQLFNAPNGGGTRTVFLDAATGNATFSGTLSGATGTFAGNLQAAGGTFHGSLDIQGNFSGVPVRVLINDGRIRYYHNGVIGGTIVASDFLGDKVLTVAARGYTPGSGTPTQGGFVTLGEQFANLAMPGSGPEIAMSPVSLSISSPSPISIDQPFRLNSRFWGMEPIRTAVSPSSGIINMTNLPGSSYDIFILLIIAATENGDSAATDNLWIRLNGDSDHVYRYNFNDHMGTGPDAGVTNHYPVGRCGPGTRRTIAHVTIQAMSSWPVMIGHCFTNWGTNTSRAVTSGSTYNGGNPITRIQILSNTAGNLASHSQAYLYGQR
jgi:chitodextrinase